jgi:hypothetical protein
MITSNYRKSEQISANDPIKVLELIQLLTPARLRGFARLRIFGVVPSCTNILPRATLRR